MKFIGIKQVAEILGVSPQTARKLAQDGRIPYRQDGGRTSPMRFREQDVVAYCDAAFEKSAPAIAAAELLPSEVRLTRRGRPTKAEQAEKTSGALLSCDRAAQMTGLPEAALIRAARKGTVKAVYSARGPMFRVCDLSSLKR